MIRRFRKGYVTAVSVLALTIALTGTSAAQTYSDVPDSLWSAKAINDMSGKNIVPGFKDATFRPDQRVSKLEALTATYRIFKAVGRITDEDVTKALLNNKAALSTYKVPATLSPYDSDVLSACAYALDKGVLQKDELKTFIVSGKNMDARKLEVAIYMGKMLNLFEKKDMGTIISLDYKDAAAISQVGAPYLNLLIEREILSSKGDANGKFNPGSYVSRAVLATMLSGLEGYVDKTVVAVVPPITPVTPVTTPTTTVTPVPVTTTPVTPNGTGVVVVGGNTSTTTAVSPSVTIPAIPVVADLPYTFDVMVEKNSVADRTMQVRDGAGRLISLYYAGVPAQSNGKTFDVNAIQPGYQITITATTGIPSKILVNMKERMISGTYQEIANGVDPATKASFKVIKVKTKSGSVEVFRVLTSTKFTKDGQPSTVDALTVNDTLSVVFDGLEARRIDTVSKLASVNGVIMKDSTFKYGSLLSIKMDKGKVFDYVLESNVILTQPTRAIEKGDIVRVYFQEGLINRIEATGMKADDRGKIKEVHLTDAGSKIVILDAKSRLTTYNIAGDFRMSDGTNDLKEGVYAFRLGQDVSLKAEMDGLKRATITKEPEKTTLKGTVREVIIAVNMIKMTDDTGKEWVIAPKSGGTVSIADYRTGDRVELIGGKLSDGIFEAESVTKIQ